jgi:beta-glucosidase
MRFENADSDEAVSVPGVKACADPLAAAKEADLVIYCGGLDHSLDREVLGWGMIYPNDRTNLCFKTVDGAEKTQEEWINEFAKANPNTVVSITAGAAVSTESFKKSVPSILLTWYPGEFAGEILLDAVFGKINPSGRLPITIGRKIEDWPCHRMGEKVYPGIVFGEPRPWKGSDIMAEQSYDDGIWVGYRGFEHFGIEPEYPFGFGLSYTTFRISKGKAKDGVFTANVKNKGGRKGRCVVQCYVSKPEQPGAEMPVKELVRFASVELEPGEEKTVSFELGEGDFRYWSEKENGWRVAKGKSKVLIGASSADLPVVYSVKN